MLDGSHGRTTADVVVSFGRPGSGGAHDVLVDREQHDAVALWKEWNPAGDVLAVGHRTSRDTEQRMAARWFSRHGEIELCGSGAVALGGFLLQHAPLTIETIELKGRYHDIAVSRSGGGVKIRLPNLGFATRALEPDLANALGVDRRVKAWVNQRLRTHIICLDRGSDLSLVQPDCGRLARVALPDLSAVIITSLQKDGSAFNFRYFTPWHGLPESPVSASANALLGPFWRARTSRVHFTAWQRSDAAPVYDLEVTGAGTWLRGDCRIVRECHDL